MYKNRYPKSWWYHTKLCLDKKRMLLMRDTAYIRSQVMSALVMGEAILPSVCMRRVTALASLRDICKLSRTGHCCCRGCILVCFSGYVLVAVADRVYTAGVPCPLTRGCCHDSPVPNSATDVCTLVRLNRRGDH